MPPTSQFNLYLCDCLLEAGPVSIAEGGCHAIEWCELQAWQTLTQTTLRVDELLDIMAASIACANAITDYAGRSVDPPYSAPISDEERAELEAIAAKKAEAALDKSFGIEGDSGG